MNQTTLARDAVMRGIGLHTGALCRAIVRPAPPDTGLMFAQNGLTVAANPALVTLAPLCTLVEAHGIRISTVEHLLAALHGLGVDNTIIEVEGDEIPILDGSALPWVQAIDAAGRTAQPTPRRGHTIQAPTTLHDGDKSAHAEPHKGSWLTLHVNVNYPHPLIGPQTWRGVMDEATFRTYIAPARTFVREADVEKARAAGLIKGGGLDNAVVFGTNGQVLNPEGLRFPDEPVRHKVLDVLGDLYMLGRPIWGKLTLTMPGHGLNNAILRQLVSD